LCGFQLVLFELVALQHNKGSRMPRGLHPPFTKDFTGPKTILG
jgi:hypothetical protein